MSLKQFEELTKLGKSPRISKASILIHNFRRRWLLLERLQGEAAQRRLNLRPQKGENPESVGQRKRKRLK